MGAKSLYPFLVSLPVFDGTLYLVARHSFPQRFGKELRKFVIICKPQGGYLVKG